MTREELKTVLASKENKLAEKLIEAIRQEKPVEKIKKLVEAGAATIFYARDPRKPRSAYTINPVLDACFESNLDVVDKTEGDGVITATLGPVHQSTGREEIFRYLLACENPRFEPGSNGYRGHLFGHILKSCFYHDTPQRASARVFAKILIESGREDINFWARNNYGWNAHMENFEGILELGVDPKTPGILDCALRYVGCSPTQPYTTDDRIAVVKRLMELGATATENLDRAISWQNLRHTLEQGGLLDAFIAAGVISKDPPEGYSRWLDYQKAS